MICAVEKRKLPDLDALPSKVAKRSWIALHDIKRFIDSLNKVPALEHIVEIHLLTDIWNQIIKTLKDTRIVYTKETLSDVCAEIFLLSLPELVQENLLFYSSAIGNSIQSWMDHMHKDCAFTNDIQFNPKNYVDFIVWTSRGTINYLETAKSLLTLDDIDVHIKFLIAGNYCLEEYTLQYRPFIQIKLIRDIGHHHAIHWWHSDERLSSLYYYERIMFRLIRQQLGTSEAVIFFWNKLSDLCKLHYIVEWLRFRFYTFSDIEPIKVFLHYVCELDVAFKENDSDLTNKILEVLGGLCEEKVWNYALPDIFAILTEIPEQQLLKSKLFLILARNITCSMRNEYENDRPLMGSYYLKILKLFWSHISIICRKSLLVQFGLLNSILYFPWSRNRNFVLQLFDEMTDTQRVRALTLSFYIERLASCVLHESWNEFLSLIDTHLSEKDAVATKKKILRHLLFDDLTWNDFVLAVNKCFRLSIANDDGLQVCSHIARDYTEKEDLIGILTRLLVLRVEIMQRVNDNDVILVELHQILMVISKRFSKKVFEKFTKKAVNVFTLEGKPKIVDLIKNFPKK